MRRRLLILVAFMLIIPMGEAQAVDNCPFPDAHGSYHKAHYRVEHRNLSGDWVWRVNLIGESCINKNGIVSAIRWTKSKAVNQNIPNNYWEFVAWTDTQTGGGVGWNHAFRRVNASFKLCYVGEIGCVRWAYPWVQVTMTNSFPWSAGDKDKGML